MSRNVSSFAPEVTAWTKNVDDFSSTIQLMVRRVKELDQQLQETTAELNNERESRKNWMKRANDVEARQKQQQFILLILDGNQSFFKDNFIRSGAAETAVQSLVAEVLDAAKSRHKNDLASDIHVIIHVFLDLDRLASDFMSAGSLSNRRQLEDFAHALTASSPCLTLTDCGPGRQGVDAKMKEFYELFIENIQCRHVILALGHDSQYYATLDTYSEDAYTLGKTSLVKTVLGFPSQYNLPFNQLEFSSIDTVPLISFGDQPDQAAGASKVMLAAPSLQLSQPAQSPGSNISSHPEDPGSESGQQGSAPSSHTSHAAHSSRRSSPAPKLPSEACPTKSIAKHPTEGSYKASRVSCEHDWERAPCENYYAPAPCTTPWGEVQYVIEDIEDPSNPPPTEDRRIPNKTSALAHQHILAPSRNDRSIPAPLIKGTPSAPRKGPMAFKGGWDDLISGQSDTVPALQSPKSPTARLSASLSHRDVALNRHGDRIDLPLPSLSEKEKQRLHRRTREHKLCNEHHLKGSCRNPKCRYDHEPIDAGMLLALSHLARTQACEVGSSCRIFDCCYGHHCPFRTTGKECKISKCSFKKMSLHHVRDWEVMEIANAYGDAECDIILIERDLEAFGVWSATTASIAIVSPSLVWKRLRGCGLQEINLTSETKHYSVSILSEMGNVAEVAAPWPGDI